MGCACVKNMTDMCKDIEPPALVGRGHSEDRRNSYDSLSGEEIENHFKQVRNIFITAVQVMQNYIGKPAYPFITYPKQLYPYILDLCDGLHDEQIEYLKDRCSKKKLRGIHLKVVVKEAKLIHPKSKELTHVYCKLWVGKEHCKSFQATKEIDRTSHLWWDETFVLNIKDYETDALHLEVWSTRSFFASWSKSSTVNQEQKTVHKTVKTSEGNYFIGDVVEGIRNMPSVSQEVYWSLRKGPRRIHTRGQIQLHLELGTSRDDTHYRHVHIHIALLRKCYEKQLAILDDNRIWKNWLEILPNPALTLIHQHAIQNGLNATEQSLCSWLVTSSLKMRNESRISFYILWVLLQDLSSYASEYTLESQLQTALRNNVSNFCIYAKEMLADLHKNFDVSKLEAADELYYLLKCMSDAELSKHSNFMSAYSPIEQESNTWYLRILADKKKDLEEVTENVEDIIKTLNDIVKSYLKNQIILDDVFKRAWSVSYTKITCKKLDAVMCDAVKVLVEHLVTVVDDPKREKKSSVPLKMLQLYHSVRNLVNYINEEMATSHTLVMNDFSSWFGDDMIIEWFLLCNVYTRPFIHRAVQADSMEPINKNIKHGTSVPDVLSIIEEMVVEVWMKLKWKDQFNTHSSLIEAIKSCILEYTVAVTHRTQVSKFFCDTPHFHISRKLCVALSNVYALCEHLHVIRDKIQTTLETAESEYSVAVVDPMENVENSLQLAVVHFYFLVLSKVEERIKGYIKAMCAAKIEMFQISVISELCNYIETTLEVLYIHLKAEAFYVTLRQLWVIVMTCLEHGLNRTKSFFSFLRSRSRIYRAVFAALNQLQNIFHCDGEGLSFHEMINGKFLTLRATIEKQITVTPIVS